MRYLSVDIETGGVPVEMTVLECALIADDLAQSFDQSRELRILVMPEADMMLVSPWAAKEHQRIWEDILYVSEQDWWKDTLRGGYTNAVVRTGEPESIWHHDVMVVQQGNEFFAMQKALSLLGFSEGETLNIAGKNPMSFDMLRLEAHGWLEPPEDHPALATGSAIRYHRRGLDPAVLYFQPGDVVLPNLDECRRRAGLPAVPPHQALYDARLVCQLLRRRLTSG